jgi:hypothetical protein
MRFAYSRLFIAFAFSNSQRFQENLISRKQQLSRLAENSKGIKSGISNSNLWKRIPSHQSFILE